MNFYRRNVDFNEIDENFEDDDISKLTEDKLNMEFLRLHYGGQLPSPLLHLLAALNIPAAAEIAPETELQNLSGVNFTQLPPELLKFLSVTALRLLYSALREEQAASSLFSLLLEDDAHDDLPHLEEIGHLGPLLEAGLTISAYQLDREVLFERISNAAKLSAQIVEDLRLRRGEEEEGGERDLVAYSSLFETMERIFTEISATENRGFSPTIAVLLQELLVDSIVASYELEVDPAFYGVFVGAIYNRLGINVKGL